MHNLAIALHKKGDTVSGSDDEIFNPARTNLAECGLLPENEGWFPDKLTRKLDAVVLGMHAKSDNPELVKARELGLKIYSFPEFLYEHAKDKKRIVVGGSHGKTTITAMVMHVLKKLGKQFDYMVGAQIEGFDVMVGLTEFAPLMIFEGDEYLTSALDKRPKFHLYKPHVAVVSGIEWDHMNVFPTKENYIKQFEIFINQIEKEGTLIYCSDDNMVRSLAENCRSDIRKIPYDLPEHEIIKGMCYMIDGADRYEIQVFGRHNLLNLNAAKYICNHIGITDKDFLMAIKTFSGAAKRLELLKENKSVSVFKDFAHAPSKLKASIEAVKSRNPERELIAVMELHTYSSLNKEFLPEYKASMDLAGTAVVFYDPHAFDIKRLDFLNREDVIEGFGRKDIIIINRKEDLNDFLAKIAWDNKNLLLMSSGNFGGLDLNDLATEITNNN